MKEYVLTLITVSFASSFLSLIIDKKYTQVFNFCVGVVFAILLLSPMFSINLMPDIDTRVPELKTGQLKNAMYEQMAQNIEQGIKKGRVEIVVKDDKISKIIITGTDKSATEIANLIGVNPNLIEVR